MIIGKSLCLILLLTGSKFDSNIDILRKCHLVASNGLAKIAIGLTSLEPFFPRNLKAKADYKQENRGEKWTDNGFLWLILSVL